jgi:hypothetical protein
MKEQSDKIPNKIAPHILNASSNLLGICFVVLTSLKVLNVAKNTIIDEVATDYLLMDSNRWKSV